MNPYTLTHTDAEDLDLLAVALEQYGESVKKIPDYWARQHVGRVNNVLAAVRFALNVHEDPKHVRRVRANKFAPAPQARAYFKRVAATNAHESRLREVARLYQEHARNAAAVGAALGVSRERGRQLVDRAKGAGFVSEI